MRKKRHEIPESCFQKSAKKCFLAHGTGESLARVVGYA